MKQHKFITLELEVESGSPWGYTEDAIRVVSSGCSRGVRPLLLFSFQRPSTFLAHGPFLHFQNQPRSLSLSPAVFSLVVSSASLLLLQGPCDVSEPIQIIQDNLFISRSSDYQP